MTTHVHIEPADTQRRAFARWALSQTPKLQTSSSTGTDVPVDLYPEVPPELLEGGFVDGFPYNRPDAPQPKAKAATKAAAAPQDTPAKAAPKPRKRAPRRPRKTAASKLTAETIAAVSAAQDSDSSGVPDSSGE